MCVGELAVDFITFAVKSKKSHQEIGIVTFTVVSSPGNQARSRVGFGYIQLQQLTIICKNKSNMLPLPRYGTGDSLTYSGSE